MTGLLFLLRLYAFEQIIVALFVYIVILYEIINLQIVDLCSLQKTNFQCKIVFDFIVYKTTLF